jgi:hypothetical protein
MIPDNAMKVNIITILILMLLPACGRPTQPIPSQAAQGKALSNNTIVVSSYELPKGVSRGFLYPSDTNPNFQIWITNRLWEEELFLDIPAPPGFQDYKETTANTDEWDFNVTKEGEDRIICFANRKDKSKSIQIELPSKKRNYAFEVLRNSLGEELLVFMDVSETVVDKGLFGYALIGNAEND